MNAYIKAISYYLPEKTLTNEQLAQEFPEWTIEKITSKVGVNERYIAATDETATDMGVQAAEKLFEEYKIDRSQIDFLLFCTQSPDYFLPTSACIMQNRLYLPTSCGALDFNLGCSGYVYGLSLAKGLITGNIAKNVLLITAETYSKHLHPKDKGNRTIFSDAAAATLISTDGFAGIGDFSLGTDGRGANNLIVKSGAFRQPVKSNKIIFDESKNPISDDYLHMSGTEIFSFTLQTVPQLVENILTKNSIRKEEINLFIFHQANKYMMDFLRKKIKLDPDKFYYYLENVGNTVSSTIPIAMKEAIKDQSINCGDKVLVAGFGVGYSWGGCVLFINERL